MNALDIIRAEIQKLYKTNPNIHINVEITSPKINLKNKPVIIKSVYPHIFQVEEKTVVLRKRILSNVVMCYCIILILLSLWRIRPYLKSKRNDEKRGKRPVYWAF